MSALEIILLIAIAAAVIIAARYVIVQHKRHGCVGCSQAKNCGHNWKNCVNQNKKGNQS